MSQQGLRQQAFRDHAGTTTGTYEQNALEAFAVESVTTGTFNERFLTWLGRFAGGPFTSLPGAMAAYAAAKGAGDFQSIGSLGINLFKSTGTLAATGTYWGSSNLGITDNQTTAPDGTATAASAMETAVNSTHAFINSPSYTKAAVAQTFTASIHVKPNGRTTCGIYFNDGSNGSLWDFNCTAVTTAFNASFGSGTVPISSAITAVANGFFRISVTMTTAATTALQMSFRASSSAAVYSYLGDVSKGFFIWGPQLERGALTGFTARGTT